MEKTWTKPHLNTYTPAGLQGAGAGEDEGTVVRHTAVYVEVVQAEVRGRDRW